MSENKIHEMFRFNYEFGEYSDDDRVESTLAFNTNGGTIDEVVEKFEQFLRGCGYAFKGELVQVDFSKWSLVERRDSIFSAAGNVYPPGQENRSPDRGPYSAYPDEGIDAWNRGQTAV